MTTDELARKLEDARTELETLRAELASIPERRVTAIRGGDAEAIRELKAREVELPDLILAARVRVANAIIAHAEARAAELPAEMLPLRDEVKSAEARRDELAARHEAEMGMARADVIEARGALSGLERELRLLVGSGSGDRRVPGHLDWAKEELANVARESTPPMTDAEWRSRLGEIATRALNGPIPKDTSWRDMMASAVRQGAVVDLDRGHQVFSDAERPVAGGSRELPPIDSGPGVRREATPAEVEAIRAGVYRPE